MIWAVYTGRIGETAEAVLVSAPDSIDACTQAREALNKYQQGLGNRDLEAEPVELPHIGEFG